MRLRKCPRCDTNAYESLETYSICHDCNFNSAEGYSWASNWDPRSCLEKSYGRPIGREVRDQAVAKNLSRILFSKGNTDLVGSALGRLPPIYRTLLYLKFWNGLTTKRISEVYRAPARSIDLALKKAYARIQELTLEDPDFSANRSGRRITPQSSLEASP